MSSKEKFDYKHRSSKEDSHKSKYNKDKDRRRKRSKSSSPKRKKHSPSSHSSSSSSTIRQTSKHKREVSRERLQKERRKRKYDSEVDNLKDKELLKRKEYELKKQKEETKRKEEQNKIKEMEKPKEKEMTEEERQQFLRRKRIAMANLVVMLGKEDQKKKEENLAKGELEEDFLAKMEESNDMFNEKKIESPTLEVIKEEETVKELPTKEELKTEISFNNNKIKLPRLPKEFAQARKEQQPKQQPIEQQEKFPNEDPLDAYMKTIEKEATVQDYQVIQILTNQTLQKRYDEITFKDKMEDDDQDTVKIIDESVNPVDSQFDQSKVITLEDILTLKETTMADDNLEDIAVDDEYHHALIQSIKDREVEANVEDKRKAMVIYQEDVNEYLKDEEFEYVEEQWLKLKRAGEKVKELKLVNHAEIKYEDFRKNLYIEPKEISNLTQEQVEQIRHEKGNIKVRGKNTPRPILNWYHCGLNSTILAVLNKLKFDEPFPIQAQAIPCIMSGRDVIGIAETGSGKTMAYVLPMLRHVLDQRPLKEGEGPIGLIMVPTRELAVQIYSEIRQFTKHLGLRVTCAYGGSGIGPQISELRRGSEIVVCTPGRLIDILCLSNGKITNLRRVTYVVLDEADRMFDTGFEPQIARILANIRPDRQIVMFSATFPRMIENLAKKILMQPLEIVVGQRGQSAKNIEQHVEVFEDERRFLRLLEILGQYQESSIIVFVDTQDEAVELWKQLFKNGYYPVLLHGGMDQEDRIDAIDKFKSGVSNILISTSVSARGLDVKHCGVVINFKCPTHLEDYVHRVGRTGRAGRKGVAFTFISPEKEAHLAEDILKVLELSNQQISDSLKQLVRSYREKLEKGEAEKFRRSGYVSRGFKFSIAEKENVEVTRKQLAKGYGLDEDEEETEIKGGALEADQTKEQNKQALAILQPSLKEKEEEKRKLLSRDPKAKQIAIDVGMTAAKNAIISGKSEEEVLELAQKAITQALAEYKPNVRTEKALENAAKIIEGWEERENVKNHVYTCEFEINDYPSNARGKAIKRDYLKSITEMFDVDIIPKGIFVEPGKKTPMGQKKLHLYIRGGSRMNVQNAYIEIKRYLDEQALMYYTAGGNTGYGGNVSKYQI